MKRVIGGLLPVLLILSCSGDINVDAEQRRLLQTDLSRAEAAKRGDLNRGLAFWTEDAVSFFPGITPARGKEAIRQLAERNRSRPGFSFTWEPSEALVAASGELGYTFGTFMLTVSGSDGQPVKRGGHYMSFWKRQSDGRWQCALESTVFGPG